MKNRETDESKKITRGKSFVNLHTGRQWVMFCDEEKEIYDAEEKTKTNGEKLTIEELRRCRGFEEISELEGNEIIESLFQLAVIVYNFKM